MATSPTETPITALRQRTLDDVVKRAMQAGAQHDYAVGIPRTPAVSG